MKTLILAAILCSNLLYAAGGGKKMSVTGLLGVPHPVNVGLDYRLGSKVSVGLTGGLLNVNVKWSTGDSIKFGTQNFEGRFRFHPFAGTFYFGLAGGVQTITADAVRSVSASGISVAILGSAHVTSTYMVPHFGWMRVAASGFTIGFEAGVYVPFNAKTSVSLTSENPLIALVTSTSEYNNLQADITKVGNDIGNKVLPFVTVLRIGWSF